MTTTTKFSGWPRSVYDFFDGLEEDNSRDYFLAHKAQYASDVRGPLEALATEASAEFGEIHIFRPQRDTRFAKDKRPYKTNVAGILRKGGSISYISVDQSGLFVGSGYYMMGPQQLAKFRLAVGDDDSGPKLAAIVAAAEKARLGTGEPDLKRVPKPFAKDHPRERLLRHKSMIISKQWEQPAWLHARTALAEITKVWRAAQNLNTWLERLVGQ